MGRKKSPARKELEIRFRGTVLDRKRLDALARVEELTPSEVMRRLIAESVRDRAASDPKGPWGELL